MIIVSESISLSKLKKMAEERFGILVKAVIDVEKEIMAVDAELHADQEALLLEKGSKQEDLWGINMRPSQGNRTRGVDNPAIRQKIIEIVNKLVTK